MERLSVCYVAFSCYPGQGATALFEYSRNLAKMGHNVNVIAAAKSDETMYEILDNVEVQRIQVKTTKRLSLENMRFSLLAGRTLKKKMVEDTPDIVHIFSHAGALLIRIGKNLTGTKWIYDIRSGPIRGLPWSLFGDVFQRLESRLFDAAFVIDEAVMKGKLGGRVFIAPSGVDLQMFRPTNSHSALSQHDIPEGDLIIVYSGSLGRQRKIENVIYAFWKASKAIGNLRLMVLGAGERLSHLRVLTEKLEISDKVLFLGYIDYQQMPEFLSAADIAVSYVPLVPAFDMQPPQKTIEYLACSLPVIATDTVGNRQLIAHERNGLLTMDDPDSLSETIIRVSQDNSLRATLSRNARSSVKDCDWETIVRGRILPAYQKILQT